MIKAAVLLSLIVCESKAIEFSFYWYDFLVFIVSFACMPFGIEKCMAITWKLNHSSHQEYFNTYAHTNRIIFQPFLMQLNFFIWNDPILSFLEMATTDCKIRLTGAEKMVHRTGLFNLIFRRIAQFHSQLKLIINHCSFIIRNFTPNLTNNKISVSPNHLYFSVFFLELDEKKQWPFIHWICVCVFIFVIVFKFI